MSEWIHPEHRDCHALLVNWGRWAVSKPHYGHCGSIEHRYKSPQCWDERNPRPPEPVLADAVKIEELMRHLPGTLRNLLVLRYVSRGDQSWCCRRLKLKFHKFEEYLYRARQMILNLWNARDSGNPTPYHYPLTNSEKYAHNPENPSKTTPVDSCGPAMGRLSSVEWLDEYRSRVVAETD